MKLHSSLFRWGYGVYCCHAGEHLNKRIKTSEVNNTNYDDSRFHKVTRLICVKQFIFTDLIVKKKVDITCSACGQKGHNKKNRSYLLHPSHPTITFDDTDNEDN